MTTAEAAARPALLRLWDRLTPKHLIAGLITLILAVAELQFGILGGFERLAAALGGCMLFEALYSRWLLGAWPKTVLSAYVSGNSLALLLKPQEDLIWPFLIGAAISIGSKYVLRYRGRHLWNPTNFGVCMLLLLAAPKVAVLSHEWGNALATNLIIWGVGLIVVARAKLLHVTVSYVIAFVAFAGVRALAFDQSFLTEVGPLTGPMYQLFVFFMITDPATTLPGRGGRIGIAVAIAAVESLLRTAHDMDVSWVSLTAPAPAFFALFTVGPVALLVQRTLKARREAASA